MQPCTIISSHGNSLCNTLQQTVETCRVAVIFQKHHLRSSEESTTCCVEYPQVTSFAIHNAVQQTVLLQTTSSSVEITSSMRSSLRTPFQGLCIPVHLSEHVHLTASQSQQAHHPATDSSNTFQGGARDRYLQDHGREGEIQHMHGIVWYGMSHQGHESYKYRQGTSGQVQQNCTDGQTGELHWVQKLRDEGCLQRLHLRSQMCHQRLPQRLMLGHVMLALAL